MTEFPHYRCRKEVRAVKITSVVKHADADPHGDAATFEASAAFKGAHLFAAGYAVITVTADWFRKHQPTKGGYFVVDGDGVTSFSPADVFEAGYALQGTE